eukprot:2159513-Pleurochrysis_carterae.AAC.1
MVAAWEDLAGQLHDVAFRAQTHDAGRLPQANRDRLLQVRAKVCPAELGRPGGAHGCATSVG